MEEKFTGKVVWFNARDGFGFIEWSKNKVAQPDMFVHFSDISVQGFRTLKKDQTVEFGIGSNNKGVDKAVDVKVLSE